jgi:hypothetical protein
MDKQTSTRTVAKRSQAFGGFQAAPVDFRGILHRQDQGHLVEAMVGGFDMTLHDVVGRDVIIFKEAISALRGRFKIIRPMFSMP